MYFSDKNDTNIDDEFKQENNILSSILSIIKKYKIIIFITIILLIILLVIFFFPKQTIINYLILDGEENITLYQGSDYIEPGYKAYNSKDEDLTSQVTIETNLNTSQIGEYEILYTIGNVSEIRKVNIIEKPVVYTYIYLKPVNNSVNVYLKRGEEYKEPGYQVFSSAGSDLTGKVKVTGKVDTSKKGSYKLSYSVVDSNNVTVSATRTVIVMDSEIKLSLSTTGYTNDSVTINVNIIDDYYDYLILPNNTKVTNNTYSYKVTENGKYTFKVYNKKGITKEESIEVKTINKTKPTGSCSGYYKDGTSTINVSSKDDIGISKYVMNGTNYTNNKITINKEIQTATITIYDKAGNTNNISCTLEDQNKVILFDKNITLNYEYISDGGTMPYALYTPSIDNKGKDIPLIVWLHGSGERQVSESVFKDRGLPKVLNNWKLDGFNAYVICPHLAGNGYSGSWNNATSKANLQTLLDKIIKEKNIDTNKIIITGHSLGGQGALYMAYHNTSFYSALAVLSGYSAGVDISQITGLPTIGYVGSISAGEDKASYNFMQGSFSNTFGSSNSIVLSTYHGNIPNMAFNQDKNNDNISDLVEWMLNQEK